jgi:hypothetical protein
MDWMLHVQGDGGQRETGQCERNRGEEGDSKFHQESVLWRFSLVPGLALCALGFPGRFLALAVYLIG